MPWDGESFAKKHNRKLHGEAADKAARVATAMVDKGVPEGIAIATGNKIGNKAEGAPKRTHAEKMKKFYEKGRA